MTPKGKPFVPLLDLATQYQRIGAEIEEAVKAVLNSHAFILGPDVRLFEGEVAAYCGSAHAVACASGSDALLLALMACGVEPGDEVITSPFSFFATAGSMVRLGVKPVFVDIHPGTFNLDPARIESAITNRTKAIMPVHLFGQCCRMDVILKIAETRGILIIEDAAQAIGAEYMGRRAGNWGALGAFSFYPSKNLGGAGDGGMITSNSADLALRARILGSHGAERKYYHSEVGVNSRLDSIQAAILRVKLRYLEESTEARRRNAAAYGGLFHNAGLVDAGHVILPEDGQPGRHVYNQYVIRARERDRLRAYLTEKGIGTEIYYPLPLHLQQCFIELGYEVGSLPVAERAAQEVLAIPVYPEIGIKAQEYVVDSITSFYSGESR